MDYPPPISGSEARGDSRPVSREEYTQLQRRGGAYLQRAVRNSGGREGLESNWGQIKDRAYHEAQKPWGGSTINTHTGEFEERKSGYAIAVRPAGTDSVKLPVPEHLNQEQFGRAMDVAKQHLPPYASHLGVFHDADEGRVDIDPIRVVHRKSTVESVGAATHATGGAYDFKTGNGVWVPHVKE